MAQTPPVIRPDMMDQAQDPLAQLRDIHLPTTIDTWPPAPGWWVLGALVLLAICAALYWLFRRWRQNRYRREALAELQALQDQYGDNPGEYVEHYSALLKRVALTRYPREVVAGLTGERWARFLDTTGGTREFSMGAGQALISGAYEKQTDADIAQLHHLGEHWIREHGALEGSREAAA